jgi:hypothetical protein
VDVVNQSVSASCHHAPLAADVLRFTPYPKVRPRLIDVLSVGRRSEPVHQALRRASTQQDFFYLFDTLPGPLVRPNNRIEHREMLANTAKLSRTFITYPAKFGAEENFGQSDVGARYFEGAAAGAVMLGQAPTASAFRDHFPWPDAVIEPNPDGSDVGEVLAALFSRPDEFERMSHRNATTALRRHDWAHRWRSMLSTAGVPERPPLARRLEVMEKLAEQSERTE